MNEASQSLYVSADGSSYTDRPDTSAIQSCNFSNTVTTPPNDVPNNSSSSTYDEGDGNQNIQGDGGNFGSTLPGDDDNDDQDNTYLYIFGGVFLLVIFIIIFAILK